MKTFNVRDLLFPAILLGCFTTHVFAASITLDTRSITSGVNNADYRTSWASQSSVISSQTLTDVNGAFGARESFSYLKIDFSSSDSTWGFQLAPDAGYGGALYLDSQLIAKETSDLWWDFAWNDNSQLLNSAANILLAGDHVLEAYWAEGCCNGSIGGRFSVDGGQSWQDLSVSNLNVVAIPNPDILSLMVLGLMALFYVKAKNANEALRLNSV